MNVLMSLFTVIGLADIFWQVKTPRNKVLYAVYSSEMF